jgi:hypothetical protein
MIPSFHDETDIIRFYVPTEAAETNHRIGETVMEHLKLQASKKFGGYTEYEAYGGWNSGDELVEEKVKVLEVIANRDSHNPEIFAKANGRFIFRNTDESVVMVMLNNERFQIEG